MHDRRFQQTHVIADQNGGAFEFGEIVQSAQMKFASAAFRDENVLIRVPGLLVLRKVSLRQALPER